MTVRNRNYTTMYKKELQKELLDLKLMRVNRVLTSLTKIRFEIILAMLLEDQELQRMVKALAKVYL